MARELPSHHFLTGTVRSTERAGQTGCHRCCACYALRRNVLARTSIGTHQRDANLKHENSVTATRPLSFAITPKANGSAMAYVVVELRPYGQAAGRTDPEDATRSI